MLIPAHHVLAFLFFLIFIISEPIENVELAVLSEVILLNTDITDLPLSVFETPDISVCTTNCSESAGEATLTDG